LSGCSRHSNKSAGNAGAAIQLYCQDCREALCVICYIEGGHSTHRCVQVKDVVGRLRSQIVADVDILSSAATSYRHAIDELAEDRDRFQAEVDRLASRIRERAETLRQSIERTTNQLIQCLETARANKLDRCKRAHETIGSHLANIDSFLTDAKTVLRHGVAGEIVKRADEIHDKTAQQAKDAHRVSDSEILAVRSIRVTLNEPQIENIDAEKFIGNVHATEACEGQWTRASLMTSQIYPCVYVDSLVIYVTVSNAK
jgi:hypothetical protein